VKNQTLYPDEILVIDASPDDFTEQLFDEKVYPCLKYFKVGSDESGLTRQRNYGIKHSSPEMDILCFLDDDIVLQPDYFEKLMESYDQHPDAIGVGGYIKDDIPWKKVSEDYIPRFEEFQFDGFARPLGERNVLRKSLGLLSDKPPGFMPDFSHGFSTGFLPPSDEIYPVEFFMGGVASYRYELFSKIGFSENFLGYGLYEDLDFCLRATRIGQLYLNTAAKVEHLHDEGGRPDHYKYGRMVIENGYHVWKLKNPNPSFKASLKFWTIHILLLMIRFVNGLKKDRNGFDDARGRLSGLVRVIKQN
jgi:GT2 family glycosyltransferase